MDVAQNFAGKFGDARKNVENNMRDDTAGYARFSSDADDFDVTEKNRGYNPYAASDKQNGNGNGNGNRGYDQQDEMAQADASPRQRFLLCLNKMSRRQLVLVIVFVALFLDNMLLTSVVPIIPTYLYGIEHPNQTNMAAIQSSATAGLKKTPLCRDCKSLTTTPPGPAADDADDDSAYDDDDGGGGDGGDGKSAPPARVDDDNDDDDDDEDEDDEEAAEQEKRSVALQTKLLRRAEVAKENVEVGVMFASKSIMQMIINPIIGPLTNRIGYSIPMFTGFTVMFLSTFIFAFGSSYNVLFAARAIQGIGSACSSVAGLGMLATYYTDDEERGRAMSKALSGLAVGVLVGPVFGGFMYEWAGKAIPFLLLAMLALADGLLQMVVLKPSVRPETQQGAPLRQLLADPYILIAAGSITFGNMGIAMLEPTLPLWMWVEMNAEEWKQGIAFLPCSVSYLIGTNLFGSIAHRIGRWRSAGIGMFIISFSLFFIPFAKSITHLIVPNFCLGFAIGMVDSSMMPLMGYLVDLRHVSVYGSVYAIADIAFCVGFAVGPLLAGAIVESIGFRWMLWCMSGICFLYAPLHYFLKSPPGRNDDVGLIMAAPCPSDYSNPHPHPNSGGNAAIDKSAYDANRADYSYGPVSDTGPAFNYNGRQWVGNVDGEGRDGDAMQSMHLMQSTNPFTVPAASPQIILAHQTPNEYLHSEYYP